MLAPATPAAAHEPVQLDMLLALFCPLLKVHEARCLLGDCSEWFLRDQVDLGLLRGVDISAAGVREGSSGVMRELRIYRYSIERLLIKAKGDLVLVPVETIFPHRRELLRRDEVAMILNCTPRHVANLPLEGPRLTLPTNAASANRTPRTYRESLIQFLNEREVRP